MVSSSAAVPQSPRKHDDNEGDNNGLRMRQPTAATLNGKHKVAAASTTTTNGQSRHDEAAPIIRKRATLPPILIAALCAIVITGAYTALRLREYYIRRQPMLHAPPGLYYPARDDAYYVIALTSLYVGVRLVLVPTALSALGRRVLPEDKWIASVRRDKVQRFAVCAFKLIHFLLVVAFGYSTLRNEPWFPVSLGGSGDVIQCYIGYPFHPASKQLKAYVLLQFSYHIHSMIMHALDVRRNDYMEMIVHHVSACFLVAFGWYVFALLCCCCIAQIHLS